MPFWRLLRPRFKTMWAAGRKAADRRLDNEANQTSFKATRRGPDTPFAVPSSSHPEFIDGRDGPGASSATVLFVKGDPLRSP